MQVSRRRFALTLAAGTTPARGPAGDPGRRDPVVGAPKVGTLSGPETMDAFWQRKYRVRSMGDSQGVRHSVHIYTSAADVDRGLQVVRELVGA